MLQNSRRKFLQSSALLISSAFAGSSFNTIKHSPNLSFSTLGCPDWNFRQIVDFAANNNYTGIELRGILRELDLTKCNEFNSKKNITATAKMMQQNKLKFVDLGSSATLHFPASDERRKNIEEGKRFIDLAHEIICPNIRVFPNNFPKDQDKKQTINLITEGLLELSEHAKGSNVRILMETHGDLVKIADIEAIMQAADNNSIGLVWDISNMWTATKEPPAEAYKKLKKYIYHTHIKDAKFIDGKLQYTLLGKGEVPLKEAIKALTNGGYKGYYSFEWEKLWHPELEEPIIALADYPNAIKQYFK
ncbi:MAG: sugar phosphate isomerase/epimerase family protein [Chitinophagaceae bacterium]